MSVFDPEKLAALGLDSSAASDLARRIAAAWDSSPTLTWKRLTRSVLRPAIPFAVHDHVYREVFRGWNGPPPAWHPSDADIENANVTALQRRVGLNSFEALHAWSVENVEAFWREAIEDLALNFQRPPSRILDLADGPEKPDWLPGALLNITDSCFLAPPDSPAIIAGSERGSIRHVSVGELSALSGRVANALVDRGFRLGDAIAIIMPMTIEAVAAYLGIIQAGCVAVSIADSFAAPEIAIRLRIARARAIICQDVVHRLGRTLPLYENLPDSLPAIVVRADGQGALKSGDAWWDEFLSEETRFTPVAAAPGETINILFSSGTTGTPKAIPWTHATPIKCAADGRYHQDIHPGDVVAWPTNMGWMMGPWLVFASLVNRATIALFDGAPTTRAFGEFVAAAGVNLLGVIPSIVRAWKESGALNGVDWSSIRRFSSTGEVSHPADMLYCMSLAGYRPVIEYCGGTEIGGGYLTGSMVQTASPGTFSTLALGTDARILDEEGRPSENGELFLVPSSLGWSTRLLNGDHHQTYFAGTPRTDTPLRRHGDQVERLPCGYFRIHGRTDDTMNIGGIKVSAAEIESALQAVPGLAETAAIGVPPADGGPLALVIYGVRSPQDTPSREDLLRAVRNVVKKQLNPLFKVHDLVLVQSLPRTASNKVMRRLLREHYAFPDKKIPSVTVVA